MFASVMLVHGSNVLADATLQVGGIADGRAEGRGDHCALRSVDSSAVINDQIRAVSKRVTSSVSIK